MNIISKVKKLVVNTRFFDRYAIKLVHEHYPDMEFEILLKERNVWIFRVGTAEYIVKPDNARLLSGDRPSDREKEVFCFILSRLYWRMLD